MTAQILPAEQDRSMTAQLLPAEQDNSIDSSYRNICWSICNQAFF